MRHRLNRDRRPPWLDGGFNKGLGGESGMLALGLGDNPLKSAGDDARGSIDKFDSLSGSTIWIGIMKPVHAAVA
ncbi:MAG: hypothetical protein ACRD1T_05215 [Acidimicrobiia bacterium]